MFKVLILRQPPVTCPLNGGGWLGTFFAEVGGYVKFPD